MHKNSVFYYLSGEVEERVEGSGRVGVVFDCSPLHLVGGHRAGGRRLSVAAHHRRQQQQQQRGRRARQPAAHVRGAAHTNHHVSPKTPKYVN
jgi:hypothetical protein